MAETYGAESYGEGDYGFGEALDGYGSGLYGAGLYGGGASPSGGNLFGRREPPTRRRIPQTQKQPRTDDEEVAVALMLLI